MTKITDRNLTFQFLTQLTPWVAALFFVFTATLMTQNFDQIINQKTADSLNPIESHIKDIQTVLQNINTLQEKMGQQRQSDLISAYNKYSNEFNALVFATAQLDSLKNNIELKNKIIIANNKSFEFIDSVKQQLLSKNIKNRVSVSEYLKNYSELSSQPQTKHDSLFRHLNSSTQFFFIGLSGFIFCSFLFLILSLFNERQQKNKLFQIESKLNTFLSVIDNMSEGVVVTNPYGFFTYYNQSALDIIGPQVKDVHYQSSLDLLGFHTAIGKKINKSDILFYSALKKEINSDQEILVKNSRNPEGIYISASSGFYVNQQGETAGSVVVMKNITHKKQLEELWIKQKESAIEGSKLKSDFLASMSHEIRTPMNGIIGLTTLLNETHLTSEQKDYVGTVQRSAHSLLFLINDILDHSKIEAGKVELKPENFNLKLLIKDAIENFKFICAEKNIQLIFKYPEALNEYFLADSNRLRQILMNLIGNAVKFTNQGHVELKLEFEKNEASTKIKFHVIDTGAGMEPHEVDHLFQRFFQTKSGLKFGGTGLGLSISKQLVDLMGGAIGVKSKINIGTTFWFELNLLQGQIPLEQINLLTLTNLENAFNGKILVAEDNLVNQKVASQYLKKLGFEVDLAKNGEEAVLKFKNSKYNLIFMDCQMPVMNGYQATQEILALQSSQSNCVPIVALTAEGTSGEKIKCFAAGMNDFLNKPLVFEQLAILLKKYFTPKNKIEFSDATLTKNKTSEIYKLSQIKVGDQWLLQVLLDDYKLSTPDLIQALRIAVQNQISEDIFNVAHTLKSASATLNAMTVSGLCQKIEDSSTPLDFKFIETLIAELEREYTLSIDEIQKTIFEFQKEQQKASA